MHCYEVSIFFDVWKRVEIIIIFYCICIRFKLFGYLTVSEVPKEAPIARKYDSRHELEEVKSSEQMKEEVSVLHLTICNWRNWCLHADFYTSNTWWFLVPHQMNCLCHFNLPLKILKEISDPCKFLGLEERCSKKLTFESAMLRTISLNLFH